MNVRITPRGWPNRTDLYTGIDLVRVNTDKGQLALIRRKPFWEAIASLHSKDVAEIALDEDGAVT